MGRKKDDGRGRLGGRAKGTPNKIGGSIKSWLHNVFDTNKEAFEKDLQSLEPSERVKVMCSLLPYVVPKLQSTSPEDMLEAEYKKLSDFLESAPDEVVDQISERVKILVNDKARQD